MTTSVANKIGNATTVGNNRACSNRESGENECSNGKTPIARGRASSKKPICDGCG